MTVILVAYLVGRGYPMAQATLAAGGVGMFQVLDHLVTTWPRNRFAEHRIAVTIYVVQGLALPAPLLTTGHCPAPGAAA